jgi:hypothetical protein
LKLEKTAWVYVGSKRVLLAMKAADKADAKKPAVVKDFRAVGVATTVALQSKKVDSALVLSSDKVVEDSDCYGNCLNAAILANYEYAHKKAAEAPKEGEDPRSKKKTKRVANLEFEDEGTKLNVADALF